ncbi:MULTISPECIES: hypothetical protein [Sphingomonas]|uniref:hypothetical protein n=1 Tax=Sphingomonas TaxID=13687 RepID=UPI0013DEF529|nr:MULTISPECIES: hypothetical protein [Sphingomonas]
MHVPTHEEVLRTIDAFLERHPKIGESRFGRDATGEPGLLGRLRAGSTPTLKVLNRIKSYMDDRDATLGVGGADHGARDTSQAQHASSGTETNISAPSGALSSVVGLPGSATTAAEGEGACSLPGGLAA